MSTKVRKLGWVKDTLDIRDYMFTSVLPVRKLEKQINLITKMPSVSDQLNIGACTSNSIESLAVYVSNTTYRFSRLFIYFNEREMEGTINEDAGAMIRDGIKSIKNLGICYESEWPYITAKFAIRPPQSCYDNALKEFKKITYHRIVGLQQMKQCLAERFPFVFGFNVPESFMSEKMAETGIMTMPKKGEQFVGGHAVVAIGYNDLTKRILVQNSWGTGWGRKGLFTMPYSFIENPDYASDMWTIR